MRSAANADRVAMSKAASTAASILFTNSGSSFMPLDIGFVFGCVLLVFLLWSSGFASFLTMEYREKGIKINNWFCCAG